MNFNQNKACLPSHKSSASLASACRLVVMVAFMSMVAGCPSSQNYSNTNYKSISLNKGDLENYGVAFITPFTVTGQEEDRQSLAFAFTRKLNEIRPEANYLSLPETLSAINKADLSDHYKNMYVDYRATGIFKRETLQKISEVTGMRYIVQLNLAHFKQGSKLRWSLLGLTISQTNQANLRVFMQIWDSSTGAIVWEGIEELTLAIETNKERPVTFTSIVEEAAKNLIQKLP